MTKYNVGDRVKIGETRGDFPLKDNQLHGTVKEVLTNEEGDTGYEVAVDNLPKEEALKFIPPLFVALLGFDGSTLLFKEEELDGTVDEAGEDATVSLEIKVGDRVRIAGGGYVLKEDQLTGTVETIDGKYRGPIELTVDNYPHELVGQLFGTDENQHLLSFHAHELVKLESE